MGGATIWHVDTISPKPMALGDICDGSDAYFAPIWKQPLFLSFTKPEVKIL